MAWRRPLFELIKQSALVNPIKKAQEQLSFSGAFLQVTTRAEAVC
jgi:hypothetical protein